MICSSIFFFKYRGPQWFVYFILDSFEMFMNNFLWTFVFSIKTFSLIMIIFLTPLADIFACFRQNVDNIFPKTKHNIFLSQVNAS